MILNTRDAHYNKSDRGTDIVRTWGWGGAASAQEAPVLPSHVSAILSESRSQYSRRGGLWAASLTIWRPESDAPELEIYSPYVSTKARAMEWLNAAIVEHAASM